MRTIELFFGMDGPAAFVLAVFIAACVVTYIARRIIREQEQEWRLKAAREEIEQLKRVIARPVIEATRESPDV